MTNRLSDESDERLCDWVDGRMSSREKERFEAELRVSKQLRERAEAYRRTVLGVRAGLAQEVESTDVAAAAIARIRGDDAQAAKADPTGPKLPSVPGAWWRSALVAAAMLALIFVLDRLEPRATAFESARAEATATAARPGSRAAAETAPPGGGGKEDPSQSEPGAFVDAPRTMVPQLTLRAAATQQKPAGAMPRVQQESGSAGAPHADAGLAEKAKAEAMPTAGLVAENAGRFGGVDVLFGELADSVRAIGPVRLQALAPASEDATQRAWVATGRDSDVRTFLANVSAAAAALGYAVENGEARAADVDARTPLAKSEAKPTSGSDPEGAGMRVVIVLERPAK